MSQPPRLPAKDRPEGSPARCYECSPMMRPEKACGDCPGTGHCYYCPVAHNKPVTTATGVDRKPSATTSCPSCPGAPPRRPDCRGCGTPEIGPKSGKPMDWFICAYCRYKEDQASERTESDLRDFYFDEVKRLMGKIARGDDSREREINVMFKSEGFPSRKDCSAEQLKAQRDRLRGM